MALLAGHGCRRLNAAPTAKFKRICLYAASRVRFAGLHKGSPPLTPLRGCWRAPTMGQVFLSTPGSVSMSVKAPATQGPRHRRQLGVLARDARHPAAPRRPGRTRAQGHPAQAASSEDQRDPGPHAKPRRHPPRTRLRQPHRQVEHRTAALHKGSAIRAAISLQLIDSIGTHSAK